MDEHDRRPGAQAIPRHNTLLSALLAAQLPVPHRRRFSPMEPRRSQATPVEGQECPVRGRASPANEERPPEGGLSRSSSTDQAARDASGLTFTSGSAVSPRVFVARSAMTADARMKMLPTSNARWKPDVRACAAG